ncbi:uncharacterized protein LOC124885829 [Capsicum annuum]|uniref:uncharacterized protein LOC124885829 n=1 Tax=Capsicum annuum TaxID=4072 RepID=UPI001FB0695A|nr:uncharacterized protein LOC124885829 [Capsicum annuum]
MGSNFQTLSAQPRMVGMIALLAFTGLLVFMVFFITATMNAIVISLLMLLAAIGGFLALFFAVLTSIYIGALSVDVFIISTTTTIAIFVVIVATRGSNGGYEGENDNLAVGAAAAGVVSSRRRREERVVLLEHEEGGAMAVWAFAQR